MKTDVVSVLIHYYVKIFMMHIFSGLMVYCAGKCSVLVRHLILG